MDANPNLQLELAYLTKEPDQLPSKIKRENEMLKSETEGELLSISYKNTDTLRKLVVSPMERASLMEELVKNFKVIVPKVVAKPVELVLSKIYTKR